MHYFVRSICKIFICLIFITLIIIHTGLRYIITIIKS